MKNIAIIATGGTITMQEDPITKSLVPADVLESLLKENSLFSHSVNISFFPLCNLDSSDISLPHWIEISQKIIELSDRYDGFVVTHGTDTMAYSATAVSALLNDFQKPVIFTGSQLPLGFSDTDALVNLEDAMYFATQEIAETCIAFCGSLYRATECTKWHTTAFDAFTAPNAKPLLHRTEVFTKQEKIKKSVFLPEKYLEKDLKEVGIIKLSPLISAEKFEKLLAIFDRVVIEGFGAGGNLPHRLLAVLEKRCQDATFKCCLKSQCFGGAVQLGLYAASEKAKHLGIISGENMTTEECVVKMMGV